MNTVQTQSNNLTLSKLIELFEIDNHEYVLPEASRMASLQFLAAGAFPTTRVEKWKHTSLKPLVENQYSLPTNLSKNYSDIKSVDFGTGLVHKLVFINGIYQKQLSNIVIGEQLIVDELSAKSAPQNWENQSTSDSVFIHLNIAFANDGIYVEAPANAALKYPVYIIQMIDNEELNPVIHLRNKIVAKKGSSIKIIHQVHSTGNMPALCNIYTEISTEPNAHLEYNVVQFDLQNVSLVSNLNLQQSRDSKLETNTISLSGKLIRNEVVANLNQANAEVQLRGIYMPRNNEHTDNTLQIKHNAPNCQSNQLYKGIIDNVASSTFLGQIYVDREGQKTNAYQSNKNILLTDTCRSYSKPQLEIYADDVKCTHGSTSGQMDKDMLFYLQTRGIGFENARRLMLIAFLSDILQAITIEPLAQWVVNEIHNRLDS